MDHHENAANLSDEEWFQEILRCWGAMDPALDQSSLAQQDAAEFVHVWFAQLQGSAFRMSWEQRLDENGSTIVFDQSHHAMPICLKFEHPFAHAMQCDLSQLFERWRQVHGMCTALVEASPCLCVHVDRCVNDGRGQISKSECKVNLDNACLVPVFTDAGLTYDHVEYSIVAIMTHLGADQSGHYRAAMRIKPSLVNTTTPAEWLLTDDWVPPTTAWHAPQWMTRSANLFWLIRSDCKNLLQYVRRMPLRDITETNAAATTGS